MNKMLIVVYRHMYVHIFFQELDLSTSEEVRLNFFNPLSPHDALKHHFTSLKTDFIFLQPRVLEREFP